MALALTMLQPTHPIPSHPIDHVHPGYDPVRPGTSMKEEKKKGLGSKANVKSASSRVGTNGMRLFDAQCFLVAILPSYFLPPALLWLAEDILTSPLYTLVCAQLAYSAQTSRQNALRLLFWKAIIRPSKLSFSFPLGYFSPFGCPSHQELCKICRGCLCKQLDAPPSSRISLCHGCERRTLLQSANSKIPKIARREFLRRNSGLFMTRWSE